MSPRREPDHYPETPSVASQFKGTMFDGNAALDATEPVRRVEVRAHLRRVSGSPLPSEAETRDTELAKHEADAAKRQALVYVRGKLLELYRSRVASDRNAEVNADDAQDVLDRWSHCPPIIRRIPGFWKGALFKGWERTGHTSPSRRNHGTALPGWRPILASPTAERADP